MADIVLEKFLRNSIVVENLKDEREKSVFRMVYDRADRIIESIIQRSEYGQEKYEEDCRYRCSWDAPKEDLSQYQTTVSFIGERGTGKTSAMESVRRYLYYNVKQVAPRITSPEKKDIHFICLDMIDAGTMKFDENIMELILAQMLEYLQDMKRTRREERSFDRECMGRNRESVHRELFQQIDELAKVFGELFSRKPTQDSFEEPGLEDLKRISDREEAGRRFKNLVRDFTHAVSDYNKWHCCYLVLAIDDLDMYKGTGRSNESHRFAMLEHIYDYLRIPNLIVLLTFNDKNLRYCCKDHFAKLVSATDSDKERESANDQINKLTWQYLLKLFPPEDRIYMTNFKYENLREASALRIIPKINGLRIRPFTTENSVSPKEFILRLIAYKTGVYFDIHGTKTHFLVSSNLRELGTIAMMINSWDDPDTSEKSEEVRSINRQLLLDYLRNQFALEKLSYTEFSRFQMLSTLPVLRQSRWLVDDIRRNRVEQVSAIDDFGYLDKNVRDRWKYSYGGLLRNLYYATRVKKHGTKENGIPSEDTIYSKSFVHCILGSHSIILNSYFLDGKKEDIMNCIASSIGGRWANRMLPRFIEDETGPRQHDENSYALGSVSMPVSSFLYFRLPDDIQTLLDCPKDWAGNTEKLVEAIALLGMFFTNYPVSGLKLKFDLVEVEGENTIPWYLSSESKDEICFNALNPFLNHFGLFDQETGKFVRYEKFIYKKVESLGKEYAVNGIETVMIKAEYYADEANAAELRAHNTPNPMTRERNQKMAKQYRILSELFERKYHTLIGNRDDEKILADEWEKALGKSYKRFYASSKKTHNVPLPVEHFDMMYNIVKRVAGDSYYDIPNEAPITEVYDWFARLYRNILSELKAQDEGYGTDYFAKKYSDTLFYRVFMAEKGTENFNPYLKPLFTAMMQRVLENSAVRNEQGVTRIAPV